MTTKQRKPRRKRTDKITRHAVSLLVTFVIDDQDAEALSILQDCWPEMNWIEFIADICRHFQRPLPFAQLLTFPGYAPTWSL